MVTKNFTGQSQTSSDDLLFCSAEVTAGLHSQLLLFSVFHVVFAITAIVGNSLILIALGKKTSLHPPSKVLFRSLAASDLCVGIIVQPCQVIYGLAVVQERWQICYIVHLLTYGIGSVLCGVSLGTLSAISVDRLLALLLGLRLRRHQSQVRDDAQEQANRATQVDITRYRKVLWSAVWVQLALGLCYLPYILLSTFAYRELRRRKSPEFYLAVESTVALIYFNSSLNPILYCWKMKEVRESVRNTLRKFVCSSN
ncbi:5-hydroxytryptamine receptor 1E-like [Montipora capricornis]|uniref:5-hydroxytryptamine receptor 1E-like n=1 Tax=Montipora capricornis TaxID=246305 RepID=UPI0035F21927